MCIYIYTRRYAVAPHEEARLITTITIVVSITMNITITIFTTILNSISVFVR